MKKSGLNKSHKFSGTDISLFIIASFCLFVFAFIGYSCCRRKRAARKKKAAQRKIPKRGNRDENGDLLGSAAHNSEEHLVDPEGQDFGASSPPSFEEKKPKNKNEPSTSSHRDQNTSERSNGPSILGRIMSSLRRGNGNAKASSENDSMAAGSSKQGSRGSRKGKNNGNSRKESETQEATPSIEVTNNDKERRPRQGKATSITSSPRIPTQDDPLTNSTSVRHSAQICEVNDGKKGKNKSSSKRTWNGGGSRDCTGSSCKKCGALEDNLKDDGVKTRGETDSGNASSKQCSQSQELGGRGEEGMKKIIDHSNDHNVNQDYDMCSVSDGEEGRVEDDDMEDDYVSIKKGTEKDTGRSDTRGRNPGGRDTRDRDTGERDTGGRGPRGKDNGRKDNWGRDTGGRDTGERDTGERDTGGRDTGGRGPRGRDTGGRETEGRDTDRRYTAGRDMEGNDTRRSDPGGRGTGGRDTGGRDTRERNPGGRGNTGRDVWERDTRGGDPGGRNKVKDEQTVARGDAFQAPRHGDTVVTVETRIKSIGDVCNVIGYARSEWKSDTATAQAVREGYFQIPQQLGLNNLRVIRGDNYCAIRATLFQVLVRKIPILSGLGDIRKIPKSLQSSVDCDWIEDWTFGSRLQVERDRVCEEIERCLEELDDLVNLNDQMGTEDGRASHLVSNFNFKPRDFEIRLLEAVKFLMLFKAIELFRKIRVNKDVPVFAMIMFARDSSEGPWQFMTKHLNAVGDTGGLEQVEMHLLGYTLGVTIKVVRPSHYGQSDFIASYPDDMPDGTPIVTLVAEDDRHYNILS